MTIAKYISSTAGCVCNAKDLELDSGDGVERGADRRRSVDFLLLPVVGRRVGARARGAESRSSSGQGRRRLRQQQHPTLLPN